MTKKLIISLLGLSLPGCSSDDAQATITDPANMTDTQKIYAINGEKVNGAPSHGLYIVDGKKVIF